MGIATIHPNELHQLQQQDSKIRILDVRSPAEFEAVHAVTADNVPLDRLDAASYLKSNGNAGSPIYVICKMGGRSMKACEQLAAAGHNNVVNVTGGTDAWAAAGLPIEKGVREVMPLDCQVRVMAGSLVSVGALLGYFLHPGWILLSLVIGAGLVYSGLTNTCGMASVLAKMPWNQANSSPNRTIADAQCDTGG